MNLNDLSERELEILDWAIGDLAEAAEDGDREGFTLAELDALGRKIQSARAGRPTSAGAKGA